MRALKIVFNRIFIGKITQIYVYLYFKLNKLTYKDIQGTHKYMHVDILIKVANRLNGIGLSNCTVNAQTIVQSIKII